MDRSHGKRIKDAKEQTPVEAYLRERDRTKPILWSGRSEDLRYGDKPDAAVTLDDGQELGIEVVEVTDAEAAKLFYSEARFAIAMRDLLNQHRGGGLVRLESSDRPPFEVPEFRLAVVDALKRGIQGAGGLPAFVGSLAGRRWEYRWPGSGSGVEVRVQFEFAPLPGRTSWRLHKFMPWEVGDAPTTTAMETRIIEEVRRKVGKAAAYRQTVGGLHVLLLNQGPPLAASASLKAAVAPAIASSPITEAWLLNWNLTVRDAEPPEPYLVQLA